MKRVVSAYIYAMSMNKNKAEERLLSYSDTLCDHAIKLALYDDSLDCKDHWIKEISAIISTANDITVKPRYKKLSKKQYDDLLFGAMGDTMADAKANLYSWVFNNQKTKEYPQLALSESTEEKFVVQVFSVFTKIRTYALDLLVTQNAETVSSIYNSLKGLL